MTTSNKLTISRLFFILLILFFMLFPFQNFFTFGVYNYNGFLNKNLTWNYIIALILFLITALTDVLDGHLARKRNEITNFGKLIDPLADKILINSIIVVFAANCMVPIWLAILFIIRDMFVDGLRLIGANKGIVMSAKFLGKQKTIWQFIGVTVVFLFPGVWYMNTWWTLVPLYIAIIFSIASWIYYYKVNWNLIIG